MCARGVAAGKKQMLILRKKPVHMRGGRGDVKAHRNRRIGKMDTEEEDARAGSRPEPRAFATLPSTISDRG